MHTKRIEIEQKYPIHNPQEVMQKLEELGATPHPEEFQDDTYYVPAHRDFLEPEIISEWLRVRQTPTKANFNYKHWLPEAAEIKTYCDEFQTGVSDIEALKLILDALNFRETVRVKKIRRAWDIDGVEVAIDSVEGLGDFLELEYKSETELIETAHQHLKKVLAQLEANVGPQDHRGYPYHLLNRTT